MEEEMKTKKKQKEGWNGQRGGRGVEDGEKEESIGRRDREKK